MKKKSRLPTHKNSLDNLFRPPRTIDPNEPCAKNPVQVRVAESMYEKWMSLPVEKRNQVLREAISKALEELETELAS